MSRCRVQWLKTPLSQEASVERGDRSAKISLMPHQKTALVTGGARRVGKAIVERLAAAGFAVAFTYHSSHDEALAVSKDAGAIPIQADLTDPPRALTLISTAFDRNFSRLDVLVNNASLYLPSKLAESDVQLSRRMMAIHFEAPLLLAKHFAPALRATQGHIVNIVDLMAERPGPGYVCYCASKAALLNLTLGLARELAPEVTVNGIAPGVVEWPPGYSADAREKYLKRVPLARAGTPKDVAESVYFLATGGAYITGQILRLDGGRSIT